MHRSVFYLHYEVNTYYNNIHILSYYIFVNRDDINIIMKAMLEMFTHLVDFVCKTVTHIYIDEITINFALVVL